MSDKIDWYVSSLDDRALFIGRFQPFHLGHLDLLKRILKDFREVTVGVGSSQYSHVLENPFTFSERHEMIQRTLEAEGVDGWQVIPIPDVDIHSQWVTHLLSRVPPFQAVFSHEPLTRQLFHDAGIRVLEKPLLNRDKLSGTEIRRRILEGGNWRELLPSHVAEFIEEIDGVARVKAVASAESHQAQQ